MSNNLVLSFLGAFLIAIGVGASVNGFPFEVFIVIIGGIAFFVVGLLQELP